MAFKNSISEPKEKKVKIPEKKVFEPLDEEEVAVMAEVARHEWKPIGKEKMVQMSADGKSMAKNSLSKAGRISIRVTDNDLEGIKTLAVNAGIPTHTYIGMLIHKAATGQIQV